jgi:hypothetical protein
MKKLVHPGPSLRLTKTLVRLGRQRIRALGAQQAGEDRGASSGNDPFLRTKTLAPLWS